MIRFDRLETLENHLRHGPLLPGGFYFGEWTRERKCGFSGCAIGHCPIVFPESFQLKEGGISYPTLHGDAGPLSGGMTFFGLNGEQFYHLFMPGRKGDGYYQFPDRYGGKKLGVRATRYDVADQIRAFRIKMNDPSLSSPEPQRPSETPSVALIPVESIAEVAATRQGVSPLLIVQVDAIGADRLGRIRSCPVEDDFVPALDGRGEER